MSRGRKWTIFWHRQPRCPINSQRGGISGDARPPLRQRPGSACFHRPHDPPGQTTASFSAPLLTSLSLCEGKVQSCILLNGKWCINSERDGPLQLQHRPTDELRHRCLFLGTVRRGNMVGKGRLEYSPCSICLPMPLSYCHLHQHPLLTETAAANTCTFHFLLVSHWFSVTVTSGLFCYIINVHRVTCPVHLYGFFSLS